LTRLSGASRCLQLVAASAAFPAWSGQGGHAEGFSVNGSEVAPEMGALLRHYGFEPGAYYIDAHGNYGRSGGAPMGNINGGPMRGWNGVEPTTVHGNAYAQAYVNGVSGIRVYYVYSPSIFSDIKGGASGYYHICPGHVYHQTHEGAISMGGGPDKSSTQDRTWVGVANQSGVTGRWQIENGPQGPVLALFNPKGGAQRVPLTTLIRGRFEYNRTKYVVETGKASC